MASLPEQMVEEYTKGLSIPEVAVRLGAARSTVRYHLARANVLRSRADGIRNAGQAGKLGGGRRGKTFVASDQTKERISHARQAWADENAVGTRITTNGYVEYTRGPHKGRSVHVIAMEARLGRRILPDEHVHHIDGIKTNNSIDNLALVTVAAHARLHRREEELMKGAK